MDRSPLIPAASEKQVSKQGKRDLNGPVTLHVLPPNETIYFQVQIVPLLIYGIPLAVHQLLCKGDLHFALTMEGA